MADAIGYPQFIPATVVVKGLEGLIAGLIAGDGSGSTRKMLAAALAAVTMIIGYFVFEAFLYPALGRIVPFFSVTNVMQAAEEILPNSFQGLIGASVAFGLWRAMPKGSAENSDDDKKPPV
jgi:uncharacterized membrane protein